MGTADTGQPDLSFRREPVSRGTVSHVVCLIFTTLLANSAGDKLIFFSQKTEFDISKFNLLKILSGVFCIRRFSSPFFFFLCVCVCVCVFCCCCCYFAFFVCLFCVCMGGRGSTQHCRFSFLISTQKGMLLVLTSVVLLRQL